MELSGKGLCTVCSSVVLFVCALSEVVVGLRCVSLGSAVKAHFHLGAAAGAFYSGLLVGAGQVLLGLAMVCCGHKPGYRNLFLLGVVVFLLGVLTAFSGAVVDGDAASLVERKFSHYCFHAAPASPACRGLREYQRSLVVSALLSGLECLLGLLNLLLIRRYQAERMSRSRRGRGGGGDERRRDGGAALLQQVSYINLGASGALDEAGAEAQRGGHPSIELPGYWRWDPELNPCFPFSYPVPSELPPAYEDIFPAEPRNT